MAQIPWWYDQPDAWDVVMLGGMLLGSLDPKATVTLNGGPALCKVKVKKGRKLDIKQSAGTHGATITDQGYKPASVDITVRIWTADQWAAIQQQLLTLEPPPTKGNATPFAILNAKTSARRVTSVLIEDIEGPDESSIRGQYEFQLKCVQFFPSAKAVTNTPKASIQAFDNALTHTSGPPPDPRLLIVRP